MKNKRQLGVSSIEFSIGIIAFSALILFIFKIVYLVHLSSINDYAISQAIRASKKQSFSASSGLGTSEQIFIRTFRNSITQSAGKFPLTINPMEFHIKAIYLKDLSNLTNISSDLDGFCPDNTTNNTVICGYQHNSPLALYQISYKIPPILPILFDSSGTFYREAIVIQEYERDQFND
ncbi:TPA: hypothetical protein RQK84_000888 [Vibrio vulnificus]|nr:hypothetical protein [Vibrio vulnificus]HDY8012858.1 hypothetical protein [Vibrio vulnificus]